MRKELLNLIECPNCKGELRIEEEHIEDGEIKEGALNCCCGAKYIISNFIPRFIETDKYVNSFSFEWSKHSRTQLDSANVGKKMKGETEKSFRNKVDFPLNSLMGKKVLDVGCGVGRFAEIASKYGAEVIAFDLSFAVDIAYKNLGTNKHVHIVQADIFHLPFKKGSFDFIYSFGVLHHTPDCAKAFSQLPELLKRGGKLSIFVYSAYNKGIVYTSQFWRFFTTKMPKKMLYYIVYISLPLYYLYKIPVLGSICKMIIPLPMWPDWRWRVLDTFDWYSPKYQSKHTHWEVYRWFKAHGLEDIFVGENEISMQGTKKR